MARMFAVLVFAVLVQTVSALWPPAGHKAPVLLFGPTAALAGNTTKDQTLALVTDDANISAWSEVRRRVIDSAGALHLRQLPFLGQMSDMEQKMFATATNDLGLQVSLESGGAVCGSGSGYVNARRDLRKLSAFTKAEGKLAFWLLESMFSRTNKTCPEQPVATTVTEVAYYAATLAPKLKGTKFFLYDALPHFYVDDSKSSKFFPANNATDLNMDLIEILQQLRDTMEKQQVTLEGYWIDSPFDFERDLEKGSSLGFEKVAATVKLVKTKLGLRVGKTFNSYEAGEKSDKDFHDETLEDYKEITTRVPSALSGQTSLDYLMVETWYPYPKNIVPQSAPYTSAYTALDVFSRIRESSDVVLV